MAVPALLAAGTVNASINLYQADGVVVDLSAAAEIQYIQKYINPAIVDPSLGLNPNYLGSNGIDPYLRIDDADLLFTAEVAITDKLSGVSGIGFAFESDTADNGTTMADELFVGLKSDFGTLTFGRQLLLADDVGNSKDYELGTEQINFVQTAGAQVIKWIYDNGSFYAGLDVDLDNNIQGPTPTVDNKGRQIYGARVGARYAGADARVYYYDGQNIETGIYAPINANPLQHIEGFNVELDYNYGPFDFATSFGRVEYRDVVNGNNKNIVRVWQVSGSYQANEKTAIAVGFDALDSAPKGTYLKHKSGNVYANVTYGLHNNATIYAEIGLADIQVGEGLNGELIDRDANVGYLLGMEMRF